MSKIFDKTILKTHKNRAAHSINSCDRIIKTSAAEIAERLLFYGSYFDTALDLNSKIGYLSAALSEAGVTTRNMYLCDIAFEMLKKQQSLSPKVVLDDELLPFMPDVFDLVLSNLSLHWSNDLLGSLIQIKSILKNNGVFIATMFGGSTLYELQHALLHTESCFTQIARRHIPPTLLPQHVSEVASKAGLRNIVVDSFVLNHTEQTVLQLMHFIKNIGESNCVINDIAPLSRVTLKNVDAVYKQLFSSKHHAINASFEIIVLSGRK